MQFRYPARLQPDRSGAIIVSFRDLSGTDEAAALTEARDALEEAIAGRIDDDEPIPVPSRRCAGEQFIAVPPDMAAKAAFALAFRASELSRLALARRLGVDEKVVRRMLDPRHHTAAKGHRAVHAGDVEAESHAQSAAPHGRQPDSQGPVCAWPRAHRGVAGGVMVVNRPTLPH